MKDIYDNLEDAHNELGTIEAMLNVLSQSNSDDIGSLRMSTINFDLSLKISIVLNKIDKITDKMKEKDEFLNPLFIEITQKSVSEFAWSNNYIGKRFKVIRKLAKSHSENRKGEDTYIVDLSHLKNNWCSGYINKRYCKEI